MSDDAIDKMKAQKVLAVCMPLHDGKLCWETWFQLREEEKLFEMLNIGWRIDPIVVAGCSLITRARNEAVANALERGAEAVMWIDGDMNWTGGGIARLLSMDKDIVAAACPLKQAETKWNVRFLPGDVKPGEKGLIEVETVGTGFMFTKRRVYEIMADRLGDEVLYDRPDGQGKRVGYFQAPHNWGEDAWFCKQWRELCGGTVWVDPAITMQHVIAPSWSVKACLAAWLDEREAANEAPTLDKARMAMAVAALRSGECISDDFTALYEAWGNGVFAATPDLLGALYDLAKQSDGPILECGSGISTLVMALANPNAEIHTLEHDPSWLMRISRLLAEHGVTNVTLHIADMKQYDEGLFYDASVLPQGAQFALVVMDGPPRHVGNRAVAYRVLAAHIEGAVLAVDDTNDPAEARALAAYTSGRSGETAVYRNDAKQFSLFIPDQAIKAVA